MMNPESLREKLMACFEAFAEDLERPRGCIQCSSADPVWWNGWRIRSVSLYSGDQMIYLPKVRLRLVRCPRCRSSWTLWPPGLIPHRHYQPCVVSHALSQLLGSGASEEQVAAAVGCARQTVGRWLRWIATLAEPATLARRLLQATGEPVVPSLAWAQRHLEAVRDATRRALLERAAEVLTLLEALATVQGVGWAELLLAVARRQPGVASEMLAM
jgi:hypothetical protein